MQDYQLDIKRGQEMAEGLDQVGTCTVLSVRITLAGSTTARASKFISLRSHSTYVSGGLEDDFS